MTTGNSILFVQGRFTVGGVERVTVLLANAFANRGWRVGVAAFKIEHNDMLKQLASGIKVCEIGMPAYRVGAIVKLRAFMREMRTTHVVNQWAFPYAVTFMLRRAMPRGARLICVYHTMPNRNKRALESVGLKRKLIECALRINSRLVYRACDAYVVLSQAYVKAFKDFVGMKDAPKLCVIPNPLAQADFPQSNKENIILYVGRLTLTEKRVDRVISVWRQISAALPEWRLEILGDGPDRAKLEESAAELTRITFRGFQTPAEYYARAKILLLTSDFEGFPMTLIEAMAAGCVPVVYGSFPTAFDIVENDCGVVVAEPWSDDVFTAAVSELANDKDRLYRFSRKGMESVKRFNIDTVMEQYLSILEKK